MKIEEESKREPIVGEGGALTFGLLLFTPLAALSGIAITVVYGIWPTIVVAGIVYLIAGNIPHQRSWTAIAYLSMAAALAGSLLAMLIA